MVFKGVFTEDNIKLDIQGVRSGGMNWTDLTHDRDRWRFPVDVVMNLRFHKMRGIS